jgi:hypothetical protein
MRGQEPLRREEEVALQQAAGQPAFPPLALAGLPRARLAAMLRAGEEILECYRVLYRANLNIVGEILRGQGTFREYDHYPADDVHDAETHAQYYYHAHRGLSGEHGHFHTYLRAGGIPPQAAPADFPHDEPWPESEEAIAHLVAISMDAHGYPIGLFAPNRRVAGDTWYRAQDVIEMLPRFRIDHAWPSWPVNRWIGAMFVLFGPHIEELLRARDRSLEAWRERRPGVDVLEWRDLEILAQIPISVDDTVQELRRLVS